MNNEFIISRKFFQRTTTMVSHQMPSHVDFNVYYDISRAFTLFCFLSVSFPILNICYNLCFKRKRKQSVQTHSFLQTRLILFVSLALYITYLMLVTYETIAQYVYLNVTHSICKILFSKLSLFILAKVFLFNYFILRANDTFCGTAYEFHPFFIQSILPFELLIVFCIIFPIQYWIIPHSEIDIVSTSIDNGQICILHFNQNMSFYGLYILLSIGGITEIIFSCIGLSLLFYKLIIVIQCTTTADIYESMLSQNKQAKDIKSGSLIDQKMSLNNSMTTTTTDSNTQRIADKIIVFHDNTANINRSLLLITKLLCLLCVQILFIVLAVTIYFITEMRIGYTVNAVCDIYCLWLTFKFSERYYYEWCLGTKCTKICFPFVKELALSIRCLCCDLFCDHKQKIDRRIFKAKYRILCCLCCCSRYYSLKVSKRKKILKMAKSEIMLLIATKLDHKQRQDQNVWNH